MVKFQSDGTFLAKWGSSGTGDGAFDWPCGVAVDAYGNVYVADTINNRIQKFGSDNDHPVASISGGDRTAIVNEVLTFDGSGSEDSDGTVESYEWDWGDSTAAGTTDTADHKWSAAGTYTVTLTVTDDDGATDDASVAVTVVEATAAIDDTISLVEDMGLPAKVEEKLVELLEEAMDKLDDGNWAGAEKKLDKFIDEVTAKNGKGKLTDAQAEELIAAAEWIIDSVNEVIDGCIADAEDAIALVEGMGLDGKVEDALVEKLDDAIEKLSDGKLDGAENKLEAFIDKVAAKLDKGKLTDEQAEEQIAAAEAIIGSLP
jgi:CRISPR/Cas system CSM-associated protein Csm2 small subunit